MTTPDSTDLWLPTATDDDGFVGPYRIIREAGSGGMGVVYLAADPDDRPVAVKVLREHIAHDFNARARLRRELQTMRRIRDRNIASVLDADTEADRPYIVTEFVHGPSLDEFVRDSGAMGRSEIIALGNGLISALSTIHRVGVVHRDLKPGNVLLDGQRPVVIDFGIAQIADDIRLTTTGLFVGTPGYVAPETIYGDSASPATDWWAWAAVLAYAATGSSPAGTGPVEVVLDRIRRGDMRLDGVDSALAPLLADCLVPDPLQRPDQAEIRHRFERYARGGDTGPRRAITPPATPPPPAAAPPPAATAVLPTSDTSAPATGSRSQPATAPPPLKRAPEDDSPRPPRERVDKAKSIAPPLPRALATPVVGAFGALIVAISMSMPFAAVIITLFALATVRTIDGFVAGIRWREQVSGSRAKAIARQAMSTPWATVSATMASLGWMILPTLCAAGTAYAAREIVPQLTDQIPRVAHLSVAAGAIVGLLVLWFGPGGTMHRKATRRVVRVLAPSGSAITGFSIVLLVATAAILFVVWRYPVLDWWPLDTASTTGW